MLVETLRRASGADLELSAAPARPAVTVLLNALRCGVDYDGLKRALPALDPAQLLVAHTYLTLRLEQTTTAWVEVAADTSVDGASAEPHLRDAARLMAVPVHRITMLRGHLTEEVQVRQAVKSVVGEVSRVSGAAGNIERKLVGRPAGSATGLRLGRSLHDGAEPGVWTHPYFLPTRVGQMSPTRVRDLLAETDDAQA